MYYDADSDADETDRMSLLRQSGDIDMWMVGDVE